MGILPHTHSVVKGRVRVAEDEGEDIITSRPSKVILQFIHLRTDPTKP